MRTYFQRAVVRVATGTPVAAFLAGAVLAAALASPAGAQVEPEGWTAPRWTGDAAFLGMNALVGGLTGGVLQRLDGGSFRDGFTRGTLGGAVAYAGRRVSADRYFGAGLLGRQVSAVGISIVRNASEGTGSLDHLVFPLGPVRFYVDRSDGWRVHPKLVVANVVAVAVLVARPETELDARRSLSSGAPVFRSPRRRLVIDGEPAGGQAMFGTIILSDVSARALRHTIFPHERVHVLQYDFQALAWSEPLERRIAARSALAARLYRHVDVGVAAGALASGFHALFGLDQEDTLREQEARFLHRRPRP